MYPPAAPVATAQQQLNNLPPPPPPPPPPTPLSLTHSYQNCSFYFIISGSSRASSPLSLPASGPFRFTKKKRKKKKAFFKNTNIVLQCLEQQRLEERPCLYFVFVGLIVVDCILFFIFTEMGGKKKTNKKQTNRRTRTPVLYKDQQECGVFL